MGWGGKRPGAGRPKGSKDTVIARLPIGMKAVVQARKDVGYIVRKAPDAYAGDGCRVPAGTPADLKELADWALSRMVDVAAERVHSKRAGSVLKAAKEIRNEICGPIAIKIEGKIGLEALLAESMQPKQIGVGSEEPTPALPEPKTD